jgi:hypothetical protein
VRGRFIFPSFSAFRELCDNLHQQAINTQKQGEALPSFDIGILTPYVFEWNDIDKSLQLMTSAEAAKLLPGRPHPNAPRGHAPNANASDMQLDNRHILFSDIIFDEDCWGTWLNKEGALSFVAQKARGGELSLRDYPLPKSLPPR